MVDAAGKASETKVLTYNGVRYKLNKVFGDGCPLPGFNSSEAKASERDARDIALAIQPHSPIDTNHPIYTLLCAGDRQLLAQLEVRAYMLVFPYQPGSLQRITIVRRQVTSTESLVQFNNYMPVYFLTRAAEE